MWLPQTPNPIPSPPCLLYPGPTAIVRRVDELVLSVLPQNKRRFAVWKDVVFSRDFLDQRGSRVPHFCAACESKCSECQDREPPISPNGPMAFAPAAKKLTAWLFPSASVLVTTTFFRNRFCEHFSLSPSLLSQAVLVQAVPPSTIPLESLYSTHTLPCFFVWIFRCRGNSLLATGPHTHTHTHRHTELSIRRNPNPLLSPLFAYNLR